MSTATRGYFITFEGIEGAGKSTQARRLFEVLQARGYPVVLTREPGGTMVGDAVRNVLANPAYSDMTPLAELFLFSASRTQHVDKVIRPALEEGRIVICDRFFDATVAYQSYGRGIPLSQVLQINQMASWNTRPDLTFLLDIEPSAGLNRVRSRVLENQLETERIERETLDFFEKVRHGYLNMAFDEPQRFRRIESDGNLDHVHNQILECTLRELGRTWGDLRRLSLGSIDI
jgi:dTMP kinase